MKFICRRVAEEMVVLTDGRITSCCLDPKGLNVYSDIREDDFEETIRKLRIFKQKLVDDPRNYPHCIECFTEKKKAENAGHHAFLVENPSKKKIENYLKAEMVPRSVVIEVTTACNLTCIGCPTGKQNQLKMPDYKNSRNLFMDLQTTRKWLEPALENIRNLRLFNYGEPLLHPGIIDFCSYLVKKNPAIKLVIATNLLPLNPKKIRELVRSQPTSVIVSLHGASQESVSRYMGPRANFSIVFKKMKRLIKERNKLGQQWPIVIWKYILFRWNDSEKEMNRAKKLATEHRIDYLGFDVTSGELASRRFSANSEALNNLRNSEFFIVRKYKEIDLMDLSR